MTHVSELILDVLDRAYHLARKEGLVSAPPPRRPDTPSDEDFKRAALAATRRFRRAQRVREYLELVSDRRAS